jgi:flagellar biosynthesis/type III secretory pathway protein FliH
MSKPVLRETTVRPWDIVPIRSTQPGERRPAAGPSRSDDPSRLREAASLQAEEIVQRALQRAEEILHQARAEADGLRDAARREGFAEGQAQGLEEVASERRRASEMIDRMAAAFRDFCASQQPDLVALATEVAEKLVLEQLTLEPERVTALVRAALDHVPASSCIVLYLHPEDVEIVGRDLATSGLLPAPPLSKEGAVPNTGTDRTQPEAVIEPSPHRTSLRIQPDPHIERGGCWIRSEHGEVDATLSGRVSRLSSALHEAAVGGEGARG